MQFDRLLYVETPNQSSTETHAWVGNTDNTVQFPHPTNFKNI